MKTQAACLLDAYFPECAGVFSDMFGAAGRAVLSKSALSFGLRRRRRDSHERNIARASRLRRDAETKARAPKGQARTSIGITLGHEDASFQAKSSVRKMGFLNAECAKVEKLIRELLDEGEPLVLTIPGISYITRAQIASEADDISRFGNAPTFVKYAGPNSSVSQSGRFCSDGGPITRRGSPYLGRALRLAANRARQYDPGLRTFYDRKRFEGKPHRVVMTAVARKLCHVIFATMGNQVTYDPDRQVGTSPEASDIRLLRRDTVLYLLTPSESDLKKLDGNP